MFDAEGRKKRRSMLRKFDSLAELARPEAFRKWNGDDAELMYSIKSIELCSLLCLGQGDPGASSFIVNMISPDQLTVQYMEVHETVYTVNTTDSAKAPQVTRASQDIARVMQGAMLDLLNFCYYETDLKDERFWNSDFHIYLLELLTSDVDKIFNVSARSRPITEVEEIFTHKVFRAMNNYIEFGLTTTDRRGSTNPMMRDFCTRLVGLLKGLQGKEVPIDQTAFAVEVKRLIAWIENQEGKTQLRIPSGGVLTRSPSKDSQSNRGKHSRDRYEWFVHALKGLETFENASKEESDKLIAKLVAIDQLTDPTDADFQTAKRVCAANGQKLNADYRRVKIKLDDLVDRFVRHCMDCMGEFEALPTITRAYRLLNLIISFCEDKPGSPFTLQECQTLFAKAGVVRMVVETLMIKPDAEIAQLALSLGIAMLKPNNEDVQIAFMDVFYTTDDSGLWQVFSEIYDAIMVNLRPVRALKEVQRTFERQREEIQKERPDLASALAAEDMDSALTPEEQDYLKLWSAAVQNCCKCIEFQQKLCEGHNLLMQDYLYLQQDNSVSVNFVERTVELVIALVKNRDAADNLDEEEMDLLSAGVDLIIEVLQGPCERNQLYCSVGGLVEQINKILRWPFANLCELEDDDPYPSSVRELKQKLCLCLNSMLELRKDSEVHKNILHRVDVSTMQDRVIFVHRYFLSRILGAGHAELETLEEADKSLRIPSESPELLVEDFTNDVLQDFFGEAWELLMVMNQLAEVDDDFKKQSRPNRHLADREFGPLDFANEAERTRAEAQKTYAKKFVLGYDFFSRWLKSIEVVVDGRIYDVWYRMPVMCDFVLGSAKRDIVNNISFSSPEEKAQGFMEMSEYIFAQTEHTRNLSKWEWPQFRGNHMVPSSLKRPFNFFLKNDSQNLMRISEYTLYVAVVLNMILANNMYLADVNDVQGDLKHPIYPILHHDSYPAVMAIAWVYWFFMLITFVISVCLYSPLDFLVMESETQIPANSSWLTYVKSTGPLETTVALLSICGSAYVLSVMHDFHWCIGMASALLMCILWDGTWTKPEGHKRNHRCPNNYWAHLIRTIAKALERRPIWRRAGLTILCWLGIFDAWYFFSFLLLDTMFQYPMLENVLKAVMIPIKSLGLTLLLGLIIMYTYAFVGFYYFRPDFEGACTNIADCTITTIYQGMRQDIGSALQGVSPAVPNWYQRVFYDLTYFIIFTTVLMNVIFGIILDTFGSLRDETQQREEYMKNVSFISCLDRSEIDKAASVVENPEIRSGFRYIEDTKQNKWNYLNYIFYLFRKDKESYSGPESYVARLLKDGDISWMPVKRARLLEQAEEKRGAVE
ncbi:unnamed protein product [Amoebophrya sp. A25]|nr:unnamed protein product [Amoebophrya sp. A25]|eukprot:GSA25T00011422001.1